MLLAIESVSGGRSAALFGSPWRYTVNGPETKSVETRTVRFHSYGEPADVLQMDETVLAGPGP
jgi:hypothetical protein